MSTVRVQTGQPSRKGAEPKKTHQGSGRTRRVTIPPVQRQYLVQAILALKSEVDRLVNEVGINLDDNGQGRIGLLAGSAKTGLDSQVVTGTAGSANNLAKWNGDGDAVEAATITDDGDVGIGQASPRVRLDVVDTAVDGDPATSGTTQTDGILRLDGTGATVLDIGVNATSGRLWIQGTSDADLSATRKVIINPNGGEVGVGLQAANPSGQLHVDQASATGARPVLYLDQADVSEEMIEFNTTIGTGNAIEAVGAKTLTTTHFIKVTLPGGLTRYIPAGTIA